MSFGFQRAKNKSKITTRFYFIVYASYFAVVEILKFQIFSPGLYDDSRAIFAIPRYPDMPFFL